MVGAGAENSCLNPITEIAEMSWPLINTGLLHVYIPKPYGKADEFVILAFSMAQRRTN